MIECIMNRELKTLSGFCYYSPLMLPILMLCLQVPSRRRLSCFETKTLHRSQIHWKRFHFAAMAEIKNRLSEGELCCNEAAYRTYRLLKPACEIPSEQTVKGWKDNGSLWSSHERLLPTFPLQLNESQKVPFDTETITTTPRYHFRAWRGSVVRGNLCQLWAISHY